MPKSLSNPSFPRKSSVSRWFSYRIRIFCQELFLSLYNSLRSKIVCYRDQNVCVIFFSSRNLPYWIYRFDTTVRWTEVFILIFFYTRTEIVLLGVPWAANFRGSQFVAFRIQTYSAQSGSNVSRFFQRIKRDLHKSELAVAKSASYIQGGV
jgi:hypothetical protein